MRQFPKMAKLFSQIWTLICAIFLVQLPVTKSQFCKTGYKFHSLTGSCMRLAQTRAQYPQARQWCQDNARSGSMIGHLVFILDEATDDFVKGILREHGVDEAIIGLHDRARNGDYLWGDSANSPTIPATYTRWSESPHKADKDKTAAIITKDGWKEYSSDMDAYFVCQVQVDFPKPKMSCPVAEVGQDSPDISCTVDLHSSFAITGVSFENTAEVASCYANDCSSNPGYVVSKATSRSDSWNLKLKYVRRSHERNWACSMQFNNTALWVTSSPCSLKVYTKPAEIQCIHLFVQSTFKVTCTAEKVYPEVGCSWTAKSQSREKPSAKNTVVENTWYASGQTYSRATCSAWFDVNDVGRYNVTVSMSPTGVSVYTSRDITVSVEPPKEAPKLYRFGQLIQSSWLEVTENQTVKLTCHVHGGAPPVYKTIISCDQILQKYESDGSSVTMDVRITREFNGRTCTCSAVHAASYTQTSRVEIRVNSPGPPRCPTRFTVVEVHPDSVRLSWTPGFDGGFKQTFTVLRVDVSSDTASSSLVLTVLGTLDGQDEDAVYEVTGLSESTIYTFGLEVTNEKGSGNCSHLQITVSTSDLIRGNLIIVIMASAIVVVVLVVFVVVVVIRRRKGSLNTKPANAADIPLTGARETSRVEYSNSLDDNYLYIISPPVSENPDIINNVPHYEEIDDGTLNISSARTSCQYQNII